MNVNLTDEQKNAYKKLCKFIKNKEQNELLLIGYAGTGKTTLVTKFINDMINNKKCKKIAIVAPTHKAVNIAKSKLLENAVENIQKKVEITTIHSLLCYTSYVDTLGNKYFAKGKVTANLSKFDLIIIDECSMLSNQIIKDIDEHKINTKLLYVGDPAQLPPVKQQDSKIFNKNIENIKLETIVRTKNNIIQQVSQAHREWVFNSNKMPDLSKFICNDVKPEMYKNKHVWLDKFVKIIKSNGEMNADNSIILTWRNERCDEYNNYIRKKLFNKENLFKYEVNEILIMDDFHKIKDTTFYSSEKIKTILVKETEIEFEKFKEIKESMLPINVVKLLTKFIESVNVILSTKLDIYSIDIKKMADIIKNEGEIPIYNINVMKSVKKFEDMKKNFFEKIYNFQHESQDLIAKIKDSDDNKTNYLTDLNKKTNAFWRKWNENVIDKIANINYGYTITTHMSQASSFINVFIDVDDILSNSNRNESLKCLYTAITRCVNTIDFLLP